MLRFFPDEINPNLVQLISPRIWIDLVLRKKRSHCFDVMHVEEHYRTRAAARPDVSSLHYS